MCGTVLRMDSYYEKEIDRLQAKIAAIYRLGRLTPTEQIAVDGLWARVEKLQTTMVKIEARENRRNERA